MSLLQSSLLLHVLSSVPTRPYSVAPIELKNRKLNSTWCQAIARPWSDAASNCVTKRSLQILLPRYYEVPNEMSCENVFHSHTVMGWHYCMKTIAVHFFYKIKGKTQLIKPSEHSNLFEKWHGLLPGHLIKRQFRRTKGGGPLSPDLFSSQQCPAIEREELWNQIHWSLNPDSAVQQWYDPGANDSISWNSVYSPVKGVLYSLLTFQNRLVG